MAAPDRRDRAKERRKREAVNEEKEAWPNE
jgi:hypothetical protein